MREVTIKLFQFEELSKEAKERACRDWRHDGHAFDSHDGEFLTESFAERLKDKGLPHEDVRWRLSYCQGDGVAFYGTITLRDWAEKNVEDNSPWKTFLERNAEASITLTKENSHYDHWNSMGVELESLEDDIPKGLLEQIEEHVRDTSRELEKIGYEEIKYHESDEFIAEGFEANEYWFEENGYFSKHQ